MRKAITVLLLAALMLALPACGQNPAAAASPAPTAAPAPAEAATAETPAQSPEESSAAGARILVAYFSRTGNTRPLAEYAAELLHADLYEITAAEPYSDADINYNDPNSRTTHEQNDPSVRPAIDGAVEDMAQYDAVVLAYPIWWGQAPRILSTFVESYDFSGKTIVPFCTSGSSGIGRSAEDLKALCPDTASWVDGRRFAAGAFADLESWLRGIPALRDAQAAAEAAAPVVYFTADISPEGLREAYDALDWDPTGRLAVKVSTGEPPASNYLRAELIGPLVQALDGTIVECNTAYGGSRASSALHRQVAEDHGFTSFADFDLMDEEGETEWPVTGGKRLEHAVVGSHAENYDDWLILSHFKGHAMAGFGGAIKNVAIGMSSPTGKVYVHSAGTRTGGSIMHSDQDAWLEAMAEMVSAVRDHVGAEHIVYINVMNRLSVDCDCDGRPAEPDIHDIGILASADPVDLDQACIDLVWQAEGNDSLVRRIESRDGLHTLEYAEEIGLGSRSYTLVSLDA